MSEALTYSEGEREGSLRISGPDCSCWRGHWMVLWRGHWSICIYCDALYTRVLVDIPVVSGYVCNARAQYGSMKCGFGWRGES